MPACALRVGISSDAGSVAKDIDAGYMTSFSGGTVLGSESIFDSWEASGPDKKNIKSSISSGGNSHTIAVANSGAMSTSVSSFASPDAINSQLDSQMAGKDAMLDLAAESQGNDRYVIAGFSGDLSDENDGLDASLTMSAAGRSQIGGDLSLLGVDGLGEDTSGDAAMVLNGLFVQSDGDLGRFGAVSLNVENQQNDPSSGDSDGTIVAGTYANYNDPSASVLTGWRWTNNPSLQLYLKTDTNLAKEKLTSAQAKTAIASAAKTWEAQTSQDLFKDSISTSSSVSADRYDKKSVHAFKYSSSDALAYSRTYYYTNKYTYDSLGNRYYRAIESDVVYNTKWSWTVDPSDSRLYPSSNTFDLQTVALHELGHTLGLGDTYLHSVYKYDMAQIMGYYNDVQRTLGAGDIKGIQALYGA